MIRIGNGVCHFVSGGRCREEAARSTSPGSAWTMFEIVVQAGNSTVCLGASREAQLQMSQPGLTCSDQRVPATLHHLQDVSLETSDSAALCGCYLC